MFRIDLAGLVITIASDGGSMRAVAGAGEASLSSRAAVSDFGFGFTLGDENVFRGTALHKAVLKTPQVKSTTDEMPGGLGSRRGRSLKGFAQSHRWNLWTF